MKKLTRILLHFMFSSSRIRFFFVTVVFAVWLSACTTGALSIDVEVTLARSETWQAQVEIIYSPQEIQLLGAQIDQGFATLLAQWEAQGIEASLKQKDLDNGNVIYTLKASGQGYAQLNAALFDGTAQISSDISVNPPQINFSYAPYGSFFSLALSRNFTLNGGEILSSNGSPVSKGTVTWFNPLDTMQATLTPTAPFHFGPLLAVVGGVLVLLFGAVRAGGRKRCWNCNARISRRAEFCTECGVAM